MTIWHYKEVARDCPSSKSLSECLYCGTNFYQYLTSESRFERRAISFYFESSDATLHACPTCGWWAISRTKEDRPGGYDLHIMTWRAIGALKNLDLTDISVPLDEAKQYLKAHYSARYQIHPRKYEEVIASVFRDAGYRVRLTSYSGDDGVDAIVLDGDQGDVIGVQAKRHRDKIEAFQIREFAGSLVLNGLTKGIFITTSSYSRGANRTAENFKKRHLSIDLWNSDRFYSALGISRRPYYQNLFDPAAPFHHFVRDGSKLPLVRDAWLPIYS